MHFSSFRGVQLRLQEGPAKNERVGASDIVGHGARVSRESRESNESISGLLPIAWGDPAIRDVSNLLDVTNPIAAQNRGLGGSARYILTFASVCHSSR
jgi:hypothetical protein